MPKVGDQVRVLRQPGKDLSGRVGNTRLRSVEVRLDLIREQVQELPGIPAEVGLLPIRHSQHLQLPAGTGVFMGQHFVDVNLHLVWGLGRDPAQRQVGQAVFIQLGVGQVAGGLAAVGGIDEESRQPVLLGR